MSTPPEKMDAGLREQNHYRGRLPWWRYAPRQWLLPVVRYETPYVAALQQSLRTPTLDAYFSITANLGTHTFFMIFLPILACCGNPVLCRAMVHILGAGVFVTGFVKDLLCLPRPLSPPLQRISMSKSAALEYGFPSTHSANALSVAVYALLALNDDATTVDPTLKRVLEVMAGTYAVSIVLGRLYCGMHGFLDVVLGGALGSAISLIQYTYIGVYDEWLMKNGFTSLSIALAIVIILIRIHPEPADDCPCFDDSVAFAGVMFGIDAAAWFHAYRLGVEDASTVASPFSLEKLGYFVSAFRIVFGVTIIIVWRYVAKKASLKILPPLFRFISKAGFLLPRRFFKQAPDYDQVPASIQMDTLIPPLSRLPEFMRSLAHPRKNRSVSVGPQSYADAYETLAYRQKIRRDSHNKLATPGPTIASGTIQEESTDQAMQGYFDQKPDTQRAGATALRTAVAMPPTPASFTANLRDQASLLDPGPTVLTPLTPGSAAGSTVRSRTHSADRREAEEDRKEEQAVFASLPKPRTKFDIEIVTKLIVYSGIGFWTVGLIPLVFQVTGLA